MSSLRPKKSKGWGINIIPLVDVLIVLIFFFTLSTRITDQKVLDITPPKMASASTGLKSSQPLTVAISDSGDYFLHDQESSLTELKPILLDAYKNKADTEVNIYADQNSPLHAMTDLMDLTRTIGLHKVRLSVL